MPINPIDVISAAKRRIVRIATIRAVALFVLPAATAFVLAGLLPQIGTLTWERMGYLLSPDLMDAARIVMAVTGAAVLIAGGIRAGLAYRASDDFLAAAEQVDLRVNGHQQVTTLATLAAPDAPEVIKLQRSPLFPLLWRNVMTALRGFSPESEFKLELGPPLRKSSIASAVVAIGLGLAMIAMVQTPTPLIKSAFALREMANRLDTNGNAPEDHRLAAELREASKMLLNPNIPTEQKRDELKKIENQVDARAAQEKGSTGSSAGSGKGSGSASGQASGNAQGKGTGNGTGAGGTGPGQGEKQNGAHNGPPNSIDLKNELAKAEAQVQTNEPAPHNGATPGQIKNTQASAPAPGSNPNQQGGSTKNPNQAGTAPVQVPQEQQDAHNTTSNGGEKKSNQGIGGDTRLGEIPAPGNAQKFYKPGENGPGIDLQDARYVVFRLPQAIPNGNSGGRTVADSDHPHANAPYTNAALAATSDNAPPDERQLVPPRYRDLIK